MDKYSSLKIRKFIHQELKDHLGNKIIITGWVEEAITEKMAREKREKREMSGFTDYTTVSVTLSPEA